MSKRYEATCTLALTNEDDERDYTVTALVEYGAFGMGGAPGARIDGEIRVYVNGRFRPLDDYELDARVVDGVEAALCEAALEDDSDQCVDHDDFEECCA